jgi:hypothetical protein
MHTVELLSDALRLVEDCGYTIRHEWLGGGGSGACLVKGKKWFFVDLALAPEEQLDLALDALRHEPDTLRLPIHHPLRDLLALRKVA